jgi:hypothetical protein
VRNCPDCHQPIRGAAATINLYRNLWQQSLAKPEDEQQQLNVTFKIKRQA